MFRLTRIPVGKTHRALHVNAHTLLAPTPSTLGAHLARQALTPASAILYTLHPDLPNLSSLVKTLQSHQIPSIGSIALAQTAPQGLSIACFTPTHKSEHLTLFHSALSGRPPAQVGKWQRDALLRSKIPGGSGKREEDRKGEEPGEMERVMLGLGRSGGESSQGMEGRVMGWDALWRSGRDGGGETEAVPEELKGVEGVDSMVLLADGTPDALLRMLNTRYPAVQKLGLLTYPTPFLTNRPFTFFHNQSVYEHGAVGIAFSGLQGGRLEGGVEYEGLEPLGPVEEIAQAQGNLLLRLAPTSSTRTLSNPTQALISAINAFRATLGSSSMESLRPAEAVTADRGISIGKGMKEEEYYLALYEGEGVKPYQVVKIMSGDPSRGAISLEMDEPLLTGQKVQFMHKPSIGSPSFKPRSDEISFTTLPQEEYASAAPEQGEAETRSGFTVGSEAGFFFSDTAGERGERIATGVCRVVGARGYLRLPRQ